MSEIIEFKVGDRIVKVEFNDEEVEEVRKQTEKKNISIARRLLKKYYYVEDKTKQIPLEMLTIILDKSTRHYHYDLESKAYIDAIKNNKELYSEESDNIIKNEGIE